MTAASPSKDAEATPPATASTPASTDGSADDAEKDGAATSADIEALITRINDLMARPERN